MFNTDVSSFLMLHPSAHSIVCADQQNPFLVNKPYDPQAVMASVMRVFSVDSSDSQKAKDLYAASIITLQDKQVTITEGNIIKYSDDILTMLEEENTNAAAKAQQAKEAIKKLKKAKKEECEPVHRLAIKRDYVVCFVLFLVVLIVLKLVQSFFKSN